MSVLARVRCGSASTPPRISSFRARPACSPSAAAGRCTLVSAGLLVAEYGRSSNPATASRPGIATPATRASWSTP